MEFKLGDKVYDSMSGFRGTITAICHYLDGPTRFMVTSKVPPTGGVIPEEWLTASRLTKDPDSVR